MSLQSTISRLEGKEKPIHQQPKLAPVVGATPQLPQPDKKLNVIFYGLAEPPILTGQAIE